MCHNDLHVILDCSPTKPGEPDVCDMFNAFITQILAVPHLGVRIDLVQNEDSPVAIQAVPTPAA
jgi:hypothetical protein